MEEWKILSVDPLPVVGRPAADLPFPHRWIELEIAKPEGSLPPALTLETTAEDVTLRCPAEPWPEAGRLSLLAVVKDVADPVRASIRLLAGDGFWPRPSSRPGRFPSSTTT